jgi:hypothetical protein
MGEHGMVRQARKNIYEAQRRATRDQELNKLKPSNFSLSQWEIESALTKTK